MLLSGRSAGRLAERRIINPRPINLFRVPRRQLAAFNDKRAEERSWGEIAKDAAKVAQDAFGKLSSSVSSALAPKPKQTPPPRNTPSTYKRDLEVDEMDSPFGGGSLSPRGGSLLPGLFDGPGGLFGGALGMLGSQMAKSSEQRNKVFEEASRRITGSAEISRRLGGDIQVMAPMSQSSSSSSINGRLTERITLIMPVTGARGRASAQVVYASEGNTRSRCNIDVRMPDGEVVPVGGAAEPSDVSTQIIDVDYREL